MSNAMIGSTGGKGGHEFSDYLVPPGARIKEVHISAGIFVDSIQVTFVQAGVVESLPRIGGSGGRHHIFVLDDDEYVTGISGHSGNYVDSVRIHTNKRTSDAFGGHGGEREFQLVAPAGSEVAGFFGRADWYVDALGIYTRELSAPAVAPAAAARRASKPAAAPESAAPAAKGRTKLVAEVPAGDTAPATASGAKGKKPQKKLVGEVPASTAAAAAAGAAATGKRRTKLAAEVPTEGPADVVSTPAASGGKRKPKLPAEVPSETSSAAQAPADTSGSDASGAGRPRAARKGRSSSVAPIEETVTSSGDTAATRFSEFAADADAPLTPQAEPLRTPHTDDLIKIEGIGPAIARLLVDNGIFDLSDLAVTPVARLREILDAAGARFRIADPTTWPEQAGYGARGDWDGMYTLQARLKAGKKA